MQPPACPTTQDALNHLGVMTARGLTFHQIIFQPKKTSSTNLTQLTSHMNTLFQTGASPCFWKVLATLPTPRPLILQSLPSVS